MSVLLVTSPHVRHPTVLQNNFSLNGSIMYSFAPVGLLSLVASTRKQLEYEPDIFDLNRRINAGDIALGPNFYRDAAAVMVEKSPHIIGFMTECDSYHHVLQICENIKLLRPNCKIVLGGPHASAVARKTLERHPYIDAIVKGEAERSWPALLAHYLGDNQQLERLSPHGDGGIYYRNSENELVAELPFDLIAELDDLPIPAYERYKPDEEEEIFLEVGRGCPFQCTFCSTAPYWQRRHRTKSPQRILAEIKLIQALYGTKRVHFTHDLFTADHRWVKKVCQTLIDAGTPILWTCSARTDTVDAELLSLMAAAGCNAIYFGIESGSQRLLKEIRKDIPLEHSLAMLRECLLQGITPNAGFIVGFPTEDIESLRDTFEAYMRALQLGCKPTHLFGFCPFAESTIYKELKEMQCSGHFLDLPLGEQSERQNRELIGADRDLFGSYFRPLHDTLDASLIAAVDEFSPLVESALLPTMLIAQVEGGLFDLFCKWVDWIALRNDSRGGSPYRRHYGSPEDFCDFLSELTSSAQNERIPLFIGDILRVEKMNLTLARRAKLSTPTTMANHRTIPTLTRNSQVELGTLLSLGNIVDKLALDYDISNLLSENTLEINVPPAKKPLFIVWQTTEAGQIRLLKIDSAIYHYLCELEKEPRTAADLALMSVMGMPDQTGIADFSETFTRLHSAIEAGLIYIEGSHNGG